MERVGTAYSYICIECGEFRIYWPHDYGDYEEEETSG